MGALPGLGKANRPQGVSRQQPVPVGGWNRKDALEAMPAEDAVICENFFPRQSDIITRNGFDEHCDTGEGTAIGSLFEWKALTSRKLVAALNGKLVDATTAASVLASGFTSNRWRGVNFGQKLFLVNGSDAPQQYDGSAVTASGWTGPSDVTQLSDIAVFKERLFFIEKNTLSFWYAGLKSVTGALTEFPLKYVGSFGGVLNAIGVISADGGKDGADDMILFYLSSGEVVVYQGSDPGDATKWAIVGTFAIGAPIGAAVCKYGSDVVAITEGAYVPITKVMPFGRTEPSGLNLSDRISEEVAFVLKQYRDNEGWSITHYPRGRKLIFNVPRSTTLYDQHVMNIDTQRWCKFTGWNFQCFTLFNNQLYGGGTDGVVYRVDYGFNDNGEAIVCDVQTAWNDYAMPTREKNFTMLRVIMKAVSDPGLALAVGVDYEIGVPIDEVEPEPVDTGAQWDEAQWDVDEWGGTEQTLRGWQGVTGVGYVASCRYRVSVSAQSVALQAGQMIMTPGAAL